MQRNEEGSKEKYSSSECIGALAKRCTARSPEINSSQVLQWHCALAEEHQCLDDLELPNYYFDISGCLLRNAVSCVHRFSPPLMPRGAPRERSASRWLL